MAISRAAQVAALVGYRPGYRVNYEVDGRPYKLKVVAEVTVCTDDFLEADGTCQMEGQ